MPTLILKICKSRNKSVGKIKILVQRKIGFDLKQLKFYQHLLFFITSLLPIYVDVFEIVGVIKIAEWAFCIVSNNLAHIAKLSFFDLNSFKTQKDINKINRQLSSLTHLIQKNGFEINVKYIERHVYFSLPTSIKTLKLYCNLH